MKRSKFLARNASSQLKKNRKKKKLLLSLLVLESRSVSFISQKGGSQMNKYLGIKGLDFKCYYFQVSFEKWKDIGDHFFRQKRSCVVEVVANCNCAQMTKEEREILLASSTARGHYSEVSFCYSESSSSPSSSSSQLLQYWVKSTLHRAGEFRTTIRLLLGASVAIARRRRLLGNASICMRQLKHFWRKISPPLLLLPSAFTSISAPMIPTPVALPEVARKQN